jgi:hypothetical protein
VLPVDSKAGVLVGELRQPLPNPLFSRVQTYGEGLVHWVKVRVDPKSNGVFSIEQRIVRSNL